MPNFSANAPHVARVIIDYGTVGGHVALGFSGIGSNYDGGDQLLLLLRMLNDWYQGGLVYPAYQESILDAQRDQ